jgi:hypothetical protein
MYRDIPSLLLPLPEAAPEKTAEALRRFFGDARAKESTACSE